MTTPSFWRGSLALLVGCVAFVLLLVWLGHGDKVHTDKTNSDDVEISVEYHGHPLHCVVIDRGPTCDWQRWHTEVGP